MKKIIEISKSYMGDISMCDRIIEYFEFSKKRSSWQDDEFFKGRTLSPSEIEDVDLRKEIYAFLFRLVQISNRKYMKFIYPEFFDIVYWPTGMSMVQHTDNHSENIKQRTYTSITYLNSNYSGGETFLSEYNYTCIPEKGKTIMFPSGYYHGVNEVKSGDRYVLAAWYTTNSKYVTVLP